MEVPFLVNHNTHLQHFWIGKKKSWKSPNSLADENVLSSNPVFSMRWNYCYPSTIKYECRNYDAKWRSEILN